MAPPARDDLSMDAPEAYFHALRSHPEWTDRQRDETLEGLIARFPTDEVLAVARGRLHDLSGGDGEALLLLVESHPAPELIAALAQALLAQPDLAPDRTWDALAVLDGAEALDRYPELVERWNELTETLDEEDGSLDELAAQLEGDPDESWLALQGLGAIEPDVRTAIVTGLGRFPLGPGLIEFFRLLSFADDPATRAPALDALAGGARDDPKVAAAWTSIAADHPDAATVARARRWLGSGTALAVAGPAALERIAPRLVWSLVTAIDGRGQSTVVLSSQVGPTRRTAAFLCDVRNGISEVVGQVDREPAAADAFCADFAAQAERDSLADVPELALRLIAGHMLLNGPGAPPALRFWVEGTIGPGLRPQPLPAPFPGWDPASVALVEMPERARAVLASCPSWVDVAPLTYEIAEELAVRYGESPPDPHRDAGAYRYLFEHHVFGQLELYRRMLFGMASFWQASGDGELGRSALALAWQLSDPQHAVASHPFTVALTMRSLLAAQTNLRRGHDPRRGPARPGA